MTRMIPKEAFDYIVCKYDSGMALVRKGVLPHYWLESRVCFVKEKLDEWIEEQIRLSSGSSEECNNKLSKICRTGG